MYDLIDCKIGDIIKSSKYLKILFAEIISRNVYFRDEQLRHWGLPLGNAPKESTKDLMAAKTFLDYPFRKFNKKADVITEFEDFGYRIEKRA